MDQYIKTAVFVNFFFVVFVGLEKIAERLIENGVDINLASINGDTALMYAADNGNSNINPKMLQINLLISISFRTYSNH